MDEISKLFENSNRYVYYLFVYVLLTGFIAPWHHFMTQFLAPPIKHWCSVPSKLANVNITDGTWLHISGQARSVSRNSSSCSIDLHKNASYEIPSLYNISDQEITCYHHTFDDSEFGPTITEKWDLVCDREILSRVSSSVYFFGMMVGVFVVGHISDKFGRKKALMVSLVMWFCAGIGAVVSDHFSLFVVMRFLVGVFNEGSFTAEFVMFMECCNNKQRATLGNLSSLGFAMGFAGLACVAYFVRNWQLIMLISSIPIIPLFIYACFLSESPLWLIARGNFEEAEEAFVSIAKFSGVKIEDTSELRRSFKSQQKVMEKEENNTASIKDIFRTPNMRKKSLIIFFIWLVNSFVYYGLTVNSGNLDGDMYINFALSGIVEVPAYLLSIFLTWKIGRRAPLSALFIIGGVSLLLILIVPSNMSWLTVTLAMIGKFGIAATFQMTYIYTVELFPTVVRSTGLGSSSMFSRLGPIVIPFIDDLTKSTGKFIPPLLYGILALLAGVLVLLLPETKDVILPQTIEDGENFIRGNEKKEETKPSTDATNSSICNTIC